MVRVPTFLRITLVCLIAAILAYRGLDILFPAPVVNSSAEMTLTTRMQRLLHWGDTNNQANRILRVTVHIFEARSTGVLPLALPPLEAAAVTRYGDQVFDIIRDTAQYYNRLIDLYPAAQFELLSAEEAMLVMTSSASSVDQEELAFEAREYQVRIHPASLDESNWLTAQITVEHDRHFLLGNRVTSLADGTPLVIGGPVEGGNKAVFVGVTARYMPESTVDQARNLVFEDPMFDHPPRLIRMADVVPPQMPEGKEEEGMPIFLTHIGADGTVIDVVLVSSMQQDYNEAGQVAVEASLFSPAYRGDMPVDSWMFVPVRFQSSRRMPVVSASKADAK